MQKRFLSSPPLPSHRLGVVGGGGGVCGTCTLADEFIPSWPLLIHGPENWGSFTQLKTKAKARISSSPIWEKKRWCRDGSGARFSFGGCQQKARSVYVCMSQMAQACTTKDTHASRYRESCNHDWRLLMRVIPMWPSLSHK